jgi:hypothetical protein
MGHSGLALVGEMARISGLDDLCQKISPKKNPHIPERDIIKTLCGLICQGKSDFDNVRQVMDDNFFQYALDLSKIPSAEIMRQRFKSLALEGGLADYLPECSVELFNKSGMQPETVQVGEQMMVRLDIDVSIMDNSDTKKEGAEYTYYNRFGFAPIFAHFGGGWLVNLELRSGNVHSYGPGTGDFIKASLEYGQKMVKDAPLLTIMDSGFDSSELMGILHRRQDSEFIIKHNLRRESEQKWLDEARNNAAWKQDFKNRKEKGTKYYGSIYKQVKGIDSPVRMVFEVTEIISQKGQSLLIPFVRINAFWTSLKASEKEIIRLYRERGTSEQYHSELKTDMDLERLPAGNFEINRAFLLLGMLVYNMLRVVSQDMVLSQALGLKKASRRRMKTVINNVMFMCGKIVRGGRRVKLKLACPPAWHQFFVRLFCRLQLA